MKQLGLGLDLSTKKTRKREFMEQMERVMPWAALVQIVEPHYSGGTIGRPPFAIEAMLRTRCLQLQAPAGTPRHGSGQASRCR
jgi:IS5 family transposase